MTSLRSIIDFVVSALIVLLTSPAWAVVALLIKLETPGPVFYRAVRVGKDQRPFVIYKFRSMVTDDASGPRVTSWQDPRITAVGRHLRRWKIDELPQLINVMRGDMSLVGPRPEDPAYVAHYTQEQRRVFTVKPGVVSPAVVEFRHEERLLETSRENVEWIYLRDILPRKLDMDLAYIDSQSLRLNVIIFCRAAFSIFRSHVDSRMASTTAENDVQCFSRCDTPGPKQIGIGSERRAPRDRGE